MGFGSSKEQQKEPEPKAKKGNTAKRVRINEEEKGGEEGEEDPKANRLVKQRVRRMLGQRLSSRRTAVPTFRLLGTEDPDAESTGLTNAVDFLSQFNHALSKGEEDEESSASSSGVEDQKIVQPKQKRVKT
jgi:hypothetical protein